MDKTRSFLVTTSDGALWRLLENGTIALLRGSGNQATKLLSLSDGITACIGYSNGDVVIVDTVSWQQILLMHTADAVRDIAFAGDRVVAIASNDDVVQIGVLTRHCLDKGGNPMVDTLRTCPRHCTHF